MSEKPILFTAEMIRAKREGRKTVTCRVITPQPTKEVGGHSFDAEIGDVVIFTGTPCVLRESRGRDKAASGDLTPVKLKPPYQVGDLLWVKETWGIFDTDAHEDIAIAYKAGPDNEVVWHKDKASLFKDYKVGKWRSSRFIPKWVARTWLEVISVRAERLQDITEDDAIAEGLTEYFWDEECAKYPHIAKDIAEGKRWWRHVISKRGRKGSVWDCPIKAYRELWDDINAKRGYPSWDSNPWVWRYEFKIVNRKL